MQNPLNLEENDAVFTAAVADSPSRNLHLTRLAMGRNWSLVVFILQMLFAVTMFALEPRSLLDSGATSGFFFLFTLNAVTFAHFDLQIKFLKALRVAKLPSE